MGAAADYKQRLHRQIVDEYAGEIVAGHRGPGEALPTETAIVELTGISRPVVREAMRALVERGLVTVRHGSKTLVNPREHWDLFDPDVIQVSLAGSGAPQLLAEYLECRRIVEIEAAGLAAERADEDGAATLGARLAEMEAALQLSPARAQEAAFHAADVAFHTALVELTGNLALLALVRRVDDGLLAARYPLARPAYRRTRALPEHRAILDAVRAQDPDGAREAMRAHLDTVEGYLREHARKVARAA